MGKPLLFQEVADLINKWIKEDPFITYISLRQATDVLRQRIVDAGRGEEVSWLDKQYDDYKKMVWGPGAEDVPPKGDGPYG